MHFLRLVLLFLAISTIVSIEVTSATTKEGDFTSHDAAPNRMLRTSEEDSDLESRGGFSIPGLSTISEKFKAGATKISEKLKRIDERLNKMPISPSFNRPAERVNKIPVNPSSIHRAQKVNKAPAAVNLNKLDEAVDVPAGYVALPGGPSTSRLNPNGLNRAEDLNKRPPRSNLDKIDEGVGNIPAAPGGDTLVSRLNPNRAEDVNKLPNKVDEGKDVLYMPGAKDANGKLAAVSLVGDNFMRFIPHDLEVGRVKLSTKMNLNKIDEGVGEIPVAPSFSTYVKSNVKSNSAETVLSSVTAAKLNTWLKEGKSFDDSFDLLQLTGKARDKLKLLDDPQFAVWLTYADDFMTKYPSRASSQMEALTRRFGDDGVVEIFAVAKQVAGKSKVAEKLESALHQHWLDKKPADMFKMMGLDKSIEKLLSESLFSTFTKFTDEYISRSGYFDKSTMSFVRTHYDDVDVVNLILRAKKDPSTKRSAEQLESALRREWYPTPDLAFKTLRIAQVEPSELFRNKMFLYWMDWMDDFNKYMYDGRRMIYRTMLTRAFKEEDLRKAIAAAKTNPKTKHLADKLETELQRQMEYMTYFRKEKDIVPL